MNVVEQELMQDQETDMAPMIDMVFLLLVFFMVASHMNTLERPKIEVPVADNATIPKNITGRRNITVKEDGTFWLGNQPKTIEEIGPMIKKDVEQNADLKIFLRGDSNVLHKEIREVMQACAANGAVQVIFSAYGSVD